MSVLPTAGRAYPDINCILHEPAEVYHAKAKEYLSSHQLSEFRKCAALYHKKKLGQDLIGKGTPSTILSWAGRWR